MQISQRQNLPDLGFSEKRFVPASKRVGSRTWTGIPQSLELMLSKHESGCQLHSQAEQGIRNLQFETWLRKTHSGLTPKHRRELCKAWLSQEHSAQLAGWSSPLPSVPARQHMSSGLCSILITGHLALTKR